MKMYAKALCLGLALAAGAASATALPGDPISGFDTGTIKVGPGTFTNDWTFALPQTAELDVNAFQVKFANTYNLTGTAELFSGTVGHGTAVGPIYTLTSLTDGVAYNNLRAGNYYFQFVGNAIGSKGGKYDLQAVAAVPEPGTYALMGIGLVGLIAFRSRKSKMALFA